MKTSDCPAVIVLFNAHTWKKSYTLPIVLEIAIYEDLTKVHPFSFGNFSSI